MTLIKLKKQNIAKEIDSNIGRKNTDHAEKTFEEPNVESHVESHVNHHVEKFVPTSDKPLVELPIEPIMDILVFATNVKDILHEDDDSSKDLRNENP